MSLNPFEGKALSPVAPTSRPFKHLSTRQLKKAYKKAFAQWESCVERYYNNLAPDHLKAMQMMSDELDERKGIWK